MKAFPKDPVPPVIKIEELFKLDDGIQFNIYVSEKPNVNIQDLHKSHILTNSLPMLSEEQ